MASEQGTRELVAAANLVDVAWANVYPFVSYLPESQSGNAIDRMQRAVVRLMRAARAAGAHPGDAPPTGEGAQGEETTP